jgi:hypothetical protein
MNKSIVIGQPVRDAGIPGPAAMSQNQLLAWGLKVGVIKNVYQEYSNWLEEARNKCVRRALDQKVTHLLFIDSDVIVPPNLITELFKINHPIVSATYFSRTPPHKPIFYRVGARNPDGSNTHAVEDYPENEVIDVDVVGMGACLIDCAFLFDMFKTFNGDGLWFAFEPGRGEDVWFCNRANKMGIKPKVHTGLLCGHVGTTIIIDEQFKLSKNEKHMVLRDPAYAYMRVMGAKSCLT